MDIEKLLTKREVADLLNISQSTLNRWMAEGVLPYIKFQQAVRFKKSDIDKFLEEKTVK